MRILLTTDDVGGVWDHTVALAGELLEAGCEVLVAVIGDPGPERLSQLASGVEVTARRYRLEWMPGAAGDVVAAGAWLKRTAVLWKPDVVHLNQMAYAVQAFPAPTLVAVHSDVLSWFGEVERRPAPPEWSAYTRQVREGIGSASALVTPTRYQADLVRRHFGRAADHVVHNGIAVVESAGDPAGTMVLSVARAWDRAKGVPVLDEAARLLELAMGDAAPEIHLLGCTLAPDGTRISPAHLVEHGRVERRSVDRWMERAGIYVAASLYEPFGLAPLEAAFQGCALVLSDIGSFRELWDGCAEFFPAGDGMALAERVATLAGDPARRARLSRAARQRARRRYTAERMATAYLEIYAGLAGARAAPARAAALA